MPSRNTVKHFDTDQMWHAYNRGANKCDIFLDEQDYKVFLSFLKFCLSEEEDKQLISEAMTAVDADRLRRLKLYKEVKLVSYCLMPNHYHLQLFQYSHDGISKLMRSVMTGYVSYFNRRHDRQGHLFQGIYKASLINSDSYWLHISRYIHLNPIDLGVSYQSYDYSSYKYYSGTVTAPRWLSTDFVVGQFSSAQDYIDFCDDYTGYKSGLKDIKEHTAD
ncbi:MAG: putative transposase [Candidatus Saccharimonadales bacterium]|jgi:putative transposase